MMGRCLVLGGAGFLGTHLCKNLYENGYNIRLYNKSCLRLDILREKYPDIEIIEGVFSEEEDFDVLLDGIDIVFHLISTTNPSNKDVFYDIQSNVLPTIRLLEACTRSSIKKLIYFSSGGTVYGVPRYIPIDEGHRTEPISAYGIHKLAVEKCIEYYGRSFGLDYNILRISNPYGEEQDTGADQGVIAVFLSKALRGLPIEIWGDGSVVRDYIFVQDVMDACLNVIDYNGTKKVFNIGTGRGYALTEILYQIQRKVKKILDIQYLPGRIQDVPVNVLDVSLVENELDWNPKVKLEQGIEHMIKAWDEKERKFKL